MMCAKGFSKRGDSPERKSRFLPEINRRLTSTRAIIAFYGPDLRWVLQIFQTLTPSGHVSTLVATLILDVYVAKGLGFFSGGRGIYLGRDSGEVLGSRREDNGFIWRAHGGERKEEGGKEKQGEHRGKGRAKGFESEEESRNVHKPVFGSSAIGRGHEHHAA